MGGIRVVAAPNAFRGSLDAAGAAAAMASGLRAARPGTLVLELPLADGGDGTAAVLLAARGGQWRSLRVPDAWGQPRHAPWVLLDDGSAVVEISAASGLGRRRPTPAQALRASSYGTGLLIAEALRQGARRVLLALGGSACSDGGGGLLAALGARLLDGAGQPPPLGGQGLAELARLDLSRLDLGGVPWTVLVDVQSPLLGPNGAAARFGPQKGAGAEEVRLLEAGLRRWATLLEEATGRRGARELPGAGAAGGSGFALAALGADIRSGAEVVAETVGLDAALEQADILLTGEGRLDAQTAQGKAPWLAASRASACGVPAVALAGSLGPGWEGLLAPQGPLEAALVLGTGPRGARQAMAETARDLEIAAGQALRLCLARPGRPGT